MLGIQGRKYDNIKLDVREKHENGKGIAVIITAHYKQIYY
jgi:hypothetical protein